MRNTRKNLAIITSVAAVFAGMPLMPKEPPTLPCHHGRELCEVSNPADLPDEATEIPGMPIQEPPKMISGGRVHSAEAEFRGQGGWS